MNCKQNVNKKKWKERNIIDITNFNRFEKLGRSPIRKKKSNSTGATRKDIERSRIISADAMRNDAGRNRECPLRNDMDRNRIFSADASRGNVGKSQIFYDLLKTPQYLNGNHKEKKKLPKMSNEAQNVLSSLHPNSTSKQEDKQKGEPKIGKGKKRVERSQAYTSEELVCKYVVEGEQSTKSIDGSKQKKRTRVPKQCQGIFIRVPKQCQGIFNRAPKQFSLQFVTQFGGNFRDNTRFADEKMSTR